MENHIILLNGSSSAGKSTLAKALQVFNANQGVIIDHVITSERIFEQLKEAVSPNRLWTVRVTCPLEIIQKREQERKDRCPGSAEASYTYLYPKDGYAFYDCIGVCE